MKRLRLSSSDGATSRRSALGLLLTIAASLFVVSPLWISTLRQNAGHDDTASVSVNSTANNQSLNATNDENAIPCTCDGTANAIPPPPTVASSFGLHGEVSDCCCTFQTVERTNLDKVHPLLTRIVATPFFAHFKIDLCGGCELWRDAPLCMLRDCGVCECERPPEWAHDVEWMPEGVVAVNPAGDDGDDCGHVDDRASMLVDSHIAESWAGATSSAPLFFEESPSPPSNAEEGAAVVVDLRLNPERYTGYAGKSAEKVWKAIHEDNCFQQNQRSDEGDEGTNDGYCNLSTEQRVYNRIISGMHSSISLHIAHSYCLEMDPDRIAECKIWGPNATLARERVLDHKDRLENLYVVFAVVLRAVQKAGPAITAAVPTDDPLYADGLAEWEEELLPAITGALESVPQTFDETSLFADDTAIGDTAISAESRRAELKRRFGHLLQIMQCVGCDRCKLWGTLQTLGVGTALRIILDDGESMDTDLSRQEAVALVHTLERFSSALVYAQDFQQYLNLLRVAKPEI